MHCFQSCDGKNSDQVSLCLLHCWSSVWHDERENFLSWTVLIRSCQSPYKQNITRSQCWVMLIICSSRECQRFYNKCMCKHWNINKYVITIYYIYAAGKHFLSLSPCPERLSSRLAYEQTLKKKISLKTGKYVLYIAPYIYMLLKSFLQIYGKKR
jgi:uncharacterized protein VirK/YbjX